MPNLSHLSAETEAEDRVCDAIGCAIVTDSIKSAEKMEFVTQK